MAFDTHDTGEVRFCCNISAVTLGKVVIPDARYPNVTSVVERQVSHEGEVVVSRLHFCCLPWIATG